MIPPAVVVVAVTALTLAETGATSDAAIIATTATTPKILKNLLFIDFFTILLKFFKSARRKAAAYRQLLVCVCINFVTSAHYAVYPLRVASTNITSLIDIIYFYYTT
jgi:hypothetical protein